MTFADLANLWVPLVLLALIVAAAIFFQQRLVKRGEPMTRPLGCTLVLRSETRLTRA